mgnify:FL=1
MFNVLDWDIKIPVKAFIAVADFAFAANVFDHRFPNDDDEG